MNEWSNLPSNGPSMERILWQTQNDQSAELLGFGNNARPFSTSTPRTLRTINQFSWPFNAPTPRTNNRLNDQSTLTRTLGHSGLLLLLGLQPLGLLLDLCFRLLDLRLLDLRLLDLRLLLLVLFHRLIGHLFFNYDH